MHDIRVGEKVLIAGLPIIDDEHELINNKIGKVIDVSMIDTDISTFFIGKVEINKEIIAEVNFDYLFKLPKPKHKNKYINFYVEYFKDHQVVEYDIFVDSLIQHNILAHDRYGYMRFYLTSGVN